MGSKGDVRRATPPIGKGNSQDSRAFNDDFLPPLHAEALRAPVADSSSDTTGTDSSDEFNWSEDENTNTHNTEPIRAKRGRRLWLAFMKLARPVRVFIIALLGGAICITPLIVVNIRFQESIIKTQVRVWSVWFTIIWLAACATYIVVDSIPKMVIVVIGLFGGQIERLKIQVEVRCPTQLSDLALIKLIFEACHGRQKLVKAGS